MSPSKRITCTLLLSCCFCLTGLAQTSPSGFAPEGNEVESVWHLGRVTGDLERIIQFYHDFLGLGLRGERNAPIPFYSVDSINEFVNAPVGAEFRAAFMPIQGASLAADPQDQIYLEAFEYRDIDRHLVIPALVDTGVSHLKFLVRDLDEMVVAAKARGVTVITAGGEALSIPTLAGLEGSSRAIMLRDPDGYPVELIELSSSAAQANAAVDSKILGAHMSLVVTDIETTLSFYGNFIGPELQTGEISNWQQNQNFSLLRNIPNAQYRTTTMLLPGSSIIFELIEFRNVVQTPYHPLFQDIGFGHIAFTVNDIEVIYERMNDLGIETISETGTWTVINPATRAIYTRDYDGFFLEIIELQ